MGEVCADMLRLFVRVSEKALKAKTSGWSRLSLFAKAASLSRDDLTNITGEMKQLLQRKILQSTADTYVTSFRAAEYSRTTMTIVEAICWSGLKEGKKEDQTTLMNALAFDRSEDRWNRQDEEPIASWTTTYRNIQHKTAKNTGEWLPDQKALNPWRRRKSTTPILAITGAEAWGRAIWLQTPSTICGSTGLARTLGRGISLPVSSWARRRPIQGLMLWGNSSSGSSPATMRRTCYPSSRHATRRVRTSTESSS